MQRRKPKTAWQNLARNLKRQVPSPMQADLEDQRRQQLKVRQHWCYQVCPGVQRNGPNVSLCKWETAKSVSCAFCRLKRISHGELSCSFIVSTSIMPKEKKVCST
ncbi:hypothetical protein AVEN_29307-1 [Araneus ventricosus]|uniref:Uncharacterized protein n=1 Tax=Araneus ventricosus TaxID=182803 RepID=A0A4Y2VS01_ARAVE|nr:hypothetical protein AVEN_29307-1 [Araneus ventricosus]